MSCFEAKWKGGEKKKRIASAFYSNFLNYQKARLRSRRRSWGRQVFAFPKWPHYTMGTCLGCQNKDSTSGFSGQEKGTYILSGLLFSCVVNREDVCSLYRVGLLMGFQCHKYYCSKRASAGTCTPSPKTTAENPNLCQWNTRHNTKPNAREKRLEDFFFNIWAAQKTILYSQVNSQSHWMRGRLCLFKLEAFPPLKRSWKKIQRLQVFRRPTW